MNLLGFRIRPQPFGFGWRVRQWFRWLPRKVKHWRQRRARGFDNSDLWNLDMTIARYVLPRLKAFRDLHDSHPGALTEEAWNLILDKMVAGFAVIDAGGHMDHSNAEREIIDEGLVLFARWNRHLWI